MKKLSVVTAIAACAAIVAPVSAQSPICDQGDIVVGLSSNTNNYAYYDASTDTWTYPAFGSASSQAYAVGTGFGPSYTQSLEFDNFDGVFGMSDGNLLAVNFGNSYTGFDVYNMATDGGSTWTSLWSIKYETGGSTTTRGGGLSINPSATRIAWISYDGFSHTDGDGDVANGSCIFVLDYERGENPGTGSGFQVDSAEADVHGPRVTGFRTGVGAAGKSSCTQGTTWLSDDIVAAFNGYGDVVVWDVSAVPAGADASPRLAPATYMDPEVDMGWIVANQDVTVSAQYTDIEYNPAVDPYRIFASVTMTNYTGALYMFDYDPATGAISLNTSLTLGSNEEPREIAIDANGDLYWTNYAGSGTTNLVGVLHGAYDPDNWVAGNAEIIFTSSTYSPYNGLDVVCGLEDTCAGDANRDGLVDQDDYEIVTENMGSGNCWFEGDFNGDGTVDQSDLDVVCGEAAPCLGDGNGDGFVNDQDFSVLLTNWGTGTTPETGDYNSDGTVDDQDFSVVLTNWGECPSGCNIPRSCE